MPGPEHRLVFEAFGVVAEAFTDDRELFELFPSVLPPDWRPATGDATVRFGMMGDGLITRNRRRLARIELDRAELAARFATVVRHYVALHAPRHIFVHAGVVGIGDAAIVVPGRSHSGKTTLVAELLERGATYYSDEYAVIGPTGDIEPYAKPLSVRASGGSGLGVPVAVPAGRIATRSAQARLIVVTRYVRGATWRPTELSSGEGALALLGHTVPARSRPAQALDAVTKLARGTAVVSGRRGEANEAAGKLLDLLGEGMVTSWRGQDILFRSGS